MKPTTTDKADMRTSAGKEFRRTLRGFLKKENLTQKMLAEFAGIPETIFNRWLQANTLPSMSDACKVAKVLRVTLNDLIPPEIYK